VGNQFDCGSHADNACSDDGNFHRFKPKLPIRRGRGGEDMLKFFGFAGIKWFDLLKQIPNRFNKGVAS